MRTFLGSVRSTTERYIQWLCGESTKKGGEWLRFEPTALARFEVDFVVDALRRASAVKPFFGGCRFCCGFFQSCHTDPQTDGGVNFRPDPEGSNIS